MINFTSSDGRMLGMLVGSRGPLLRNDKVTVFVSHPFVTLSGGNSASFINLVLLLLFFNMTFFLLVEFPCDKCTTSAAETEKGGRREGNISA